LVSDFFLESTSALISHLIFPRRLHDVQFDQFSTTIGSAAIGQQREMRQGMAAFTAFLSNFAVGINRTWPFVVIPGFENYARDHLKQSHSEVLAVFPKVEAAAGQDYLDFVGANVHDIMLDGHMAQKGSLERLADVHGDGYNPYFSAPDGSGMFLRAPVRDDQYFPTLYYSPPPSTYGLFNWDMQTAGDYNSLLYGIHKVRFFCIMFCTVLLSINSNSIYPP